MAAPKVTLSARQEGESLFIKAEFGPEHSREFELSPSHPLYLQFAAQGYNSKVRSQVASAKSPEEAAAAYDSLVAAFNKGQWNPLRNSGSVESGGILVRALARLKGASIEQAQLFVSKLSKKQAADLRKVPEVAVVIAQLNAEAPKQDEATVNLLDSFGVEAEKNIPEEIELPTE